MARDFPNTLTNYLESASTPITAAPFTISAWLNTDTLASSDTAAGIFNGGSDFNFWELQIPATANVVFQIKDSGGSTKTASAAGMTTGVWHHVIGHEVSSSDRRVRRTNDFTTTNTGTNTVAATLTGSSRITVGHRGILTRSNGFDGKIGHLALWNIALTDNDGLSLAMGISPLRLKADNLVGYWPINGVAAPEKNLIAGGVGLVLTGTLARVNEPPIPYSLKFI